MTRRKVLIFTQAHFFETMTPAHFSVGDDALHAAIDHGFYARPATFYRVYEDMFAAARGPYLDQGHAYFPLDYENLVRAYRLDAANAAHVRMVKQHPTLAYRYKRVNVVEAAGFLVYPTSVYNKDRDKLIQNIERHLRAKLPIDNGIYTNKHRGNRPFSSEKFHMVHALARAPRFADFAAPTVGVLVRPRPAAAPGSCPRPTHDALLQAWRDALADPPEDTSERPREKRRRTPSQTRPNKRRENKRRQDVCPRKTRCWTRGGTRWPRRYPKASASILVQSRRPGSPRRQSTGSSAALTWRISGDTPTASRRRPTSTPEARASGRKRPEVGSCVNSTSRNLVYN